MTSGRASNERRQTTGTEAFRGAPSATLPPPYRPMTRRGRLRGGAAFGVLEVRTGGVPVDPALTFRQLVLEAGYLDQHARQRYQSVSISASSPVPLRVADFLEG